VLQAAPGNGLGTLKLQRSCFSAQAAPLYAAAVDGLEETLGQDANTQAARWGCTVESVDVV